GRRRDQAARRRRARRWLFAAGASLALIIAAIGTTLYLGARNRLEAETEKQRLALENERRDNAAKSARVLVDQARAMLDRDDPWSAARLLSVAYGIPGDDRSPELAMLVKRFTSLDSLLAAVLLPTSGVTALAFSGDGTKLFAGHEDGTVSMWSTTDWRLTTFNAHSLTAASSARTNEASTARPRPITAVAATFDGRYLVTADTDSARRWNTATGEDLVLPHSLGPGVMDISSDGAAVVWTYHDSSALWYRDETYKVWNAPAVSEKCWADVRTQREDGQDTSTTGGKPHEGTTRIAISGDAKTIALYRYAMRTHARAGELSLYRLGNGEPALLSRTCDPAAPDIDQILIDATGTSIALEWETCKPSAQCIPYSVGYHWSAASRALERTTASSGRLWPGQAKERPHSRFDALRPDLMVTVGYDGASISGSPRAPRRPLELPCGAVGAEIDLVDGRLAMVGLCARFVIAGLDGSAVSGELPPASYSAVRISAAARLAATLSSDGTIRAWHLDTARDRTLRSEIHVSHVDYTDDEHLVVYDGEVARLLAISPPGGDPAVDNAVIAESPSDAIPLVRRDHRVVVSHDQQIATLVPVGRIPHAAVARGVAKRWLADSRDSDELLAIASDDLHCRMLNGALETRAEGKLQATALLRSRLRALSYAPSGRWMLGAHADGTVTRFDGDGRPLGTTSFPGGARDVEPAARGDGMLAIGDFSIAGWRSEGRPATFESRDRVFERAAAWDADSGALLIATASALTRFDLESHAEKWRKPYPFMIPLLTSLQLGATDSVSVALVATVSDLHLFALDGRPLRQLGASHTPRTPIRDAWFVGTGLLLTQEMQSPIATLWNTRSGKPLASVAATALARSPAGAFAIADSRGVHIAHVQDSAFVDDRSLRCDAFGSEQPSAVAWSSDGQAIAASARSPGSADSTSDQICVWDATTTTLVKSWDSQQSQIRALSFSRDNRLLAIGADDPARLWDARRGALLTEFAYERLIATAFAGTQPFAVTEDGAGTLRIYDPRTTRRLSLVARNAARGESLAAVDEMSASIAVVDTRGAVAVIDLRTGSRVRELPPDDKKPVAISIAPGGNAIAIATEQQVRLWSAIATPTPRVAVLDASHVEALAFSPDGAWLATADGFETVPEHGLLALWNVEDGHRMLSFKTDNPLTAVSWSRDGNHLVVGGRDGLINAFDLSRELRSPGEVTRILDRMAPRAAPQAASPPISDPSPGPKHEVGLIDI
ncbi:MAG TPA: WD40 repeat domain-containing protein, partial [Kofleriaceae bacterium]